METQIDSKIQHHWEVFEKKWEDKIVQLEPGSKEGTITMTENRMCTNVQKEMEKVWRERMDREDKITTTNIETLRSEVHLEDIRMSARLNEEVVCMKNRHQGSAASTVAASTGSGGSARNFVVQNTFVASRT